jgi:hypothetical protein
MAVPVNAEFLKLVIDKRFGSVDGFAADWEERVREGRQRRGKARDRATIYRWLGKDIPSKEDDLFGLCGALDIDPLSVLPINHSFMEKEFAQERLRLQLNQSRTSNLKPYDAIFLPGPKWPSDEIAECFYGRRWHVQEFHHDPSIISSAYAGLELRIPPYQDVPVVFHFAWRRSNARDRMWRPYGSVIRFDNKILLISESGDLQKVDINFHENPTIVETYFGIGSAMFRIASLHDFEISMPIQLPSQAKNAVRFVA